MARRSDRPYKLLHRVADSHAPAMARTFKNSVLAARRRATDAVISHAIANFGAHGEILDLLDSLTIAKADPLVDATDSYANILVQAMQTMGPYDAELYGAEVNTLLASLSVINPAVVRQAQTMASKLLDNITSESQSAVRDAITRGVLGQLDADALRGLIREVIGLNSQQAKALTNYRIGLEDVPNAETLMQRYGETLLSQRADTIARTETMQAANEGQQFLWGEMADAGIIDRASFVQVWLVTDDELLCDDCAPMAEDQASLDGSFTQDEKGVLPSDREPYAGDTVDSPPLHPNCRCTLVSEQG